MSKNKYFDLNTREMANEESFKGTRLLNESWQKIMKEGHKPGIKGPTGAQLTAMSKKNLKESSLPPVGGNQPPKPVLPKEPLIPENEDPTLPAEGDQPPVDAPAEGGADDSTAKEADASAQVKAFIDTLTLPSDATFTELPRAPEGENLPTVPEGDALPPTDPTATSAPAPEGDLPINEAEGDTPPAEGDATQADPSTDIPPTDAPAPEASSDPTGIYSAEVNDEQNGTFVIVVYPKAMYANLTAVAKTTEGETDSSIPAEPSDASPLDSAEAAPVAEPTETTELEEGKKPDEKKEELKETDDKDADDKKDLDESEDKDEDDKTEQQLDESRDPTTIGKKDWKLFTESRYKK